MSAVRARVRALATALALLAIAMTVGATIAAADEREPRHRAAGDAPGRVADGADRGANWSVKQEQWYVLRLAGVDCGWMRTALFDDGARYRTETQMSLSLDRGGEVVRVATETAFDETHRGKPLRLRTMQQMGQEPVETIYEFGQFDADGADEANGADGAATRRVRRIVRQGGGESVGEEAWPDGSWLPPAAADRLFAMRRDAGAKEIVYDTIDGQTGLQVATVRSIRVGEERIEIAGRSVPVTRWRISTSAVPVETIALFGVDGVLVHSRVDLGFGELETRLATEAEVLQLRPGRLPDVIISTVVRPDRPIRDVLRTRRAEFRISLPEGSQLPELPSVGAQRFERIDARAGLVRVDRDRPLPATEAEIKNDAYRTASPTVDSDDPVVRTLHQRATRGMDRRTPAERAEACRAFVGRHVRDKGLEVAFATASEVARRGEGDCSEHAVLLCALLRADGIASRLASGLIYVDEFAGQRAVFGWHMWTQALLEVESEDEHGGETEWRWIDLDATLRRPNHAAYVLTGTTSLSQGPTDPSMTAMLPLMGRMSIEVVDYGPGGAARTPDRRPAQRPRRRRRRSELQAA